MVWAKELICHRSCLEAEFGVPSSVVCPDCGASLKDYRIPAFGQSHDAPRGCPNCGRLTPLEGDSLCSVCGLPIYSFQKREIGRLRSADDDSSCHTLHGFCAKSDRADVYLAQPGSYGILDRLQVPYSWIMALVHDLVVAFGFVGDDYFLFRSKPVRERIHALAVLCALAALACIVVMAWHALDQFPGRGVK